MLHDIACFAFGIGIFFLGAGLRKYRPKKPQEISPHFIVFNANPNPVEARMQFNKEQVFEILAEYTAMRRRMQGGDYIYHGIYTINMQDGIINVRIELKKRNHHAS